MAKKYLLVKCVGNDSSSVYRIVENPCFILDKILVIGEFDSVLKAAIGLVAYLTEAIP